MRTASQARHALVLTSVCWTACIAYAQPTRLLIELPLDDPRAVSADGSVVVGSVYVAASSSTEAVAWDFGGGLATITPGIAMDVTGTSMMGSNGFSVVGLAEDEMCQLSAGIGADGPFLYTGGSPTSGPAGFVESVGVNSTFFAAGISDTGIINPGPRTVVGIAGVKGYNYFETGPCDPTNGTMEGAIEDENMIPVPMGPDDVATLHGISADARFAIGMLRESGVEASDILNFFRGRFIDPMRLPGSGGSTLLQPRGGLIAGRTYAYRWPLYQPLASREPEYLPSLEPGGLFGPGSWELANAISDSGSVIVGEASWDAPSGNDYPGTNAVLWRAGASTGTGFEATLLDPNGDFGDSAAFAVSSDGATAVGVAYSTGTSDQTAFIWDAADGIRDLNIVLQQENVAFGNFAHLTQARAISGDGRTIVGVGETTTGEEVGFIVVADCNSNGVPDVLDVDPTDPDGNSQTSADCNGNLVPDECEPDCNGNGVPDDCDTDPSDPDGDGVVYDDCNGNRVPDSCDLLVFDCNHNGIIDACECLVDMVLVVDTSGSMSTAISNLCDIIDPLIAMVSMTPVDLQLTIITVDGGNVCGPADSLTGLFSTSERTLPVLSQGEPIVAGSETGDAGIAGRQCNNNPMIDQLTTEDWGAASAVVALQWPWRSAPSGHTARRIVVPITDDSPRCGINCESDFDFVQSAVEAMVASILQADKPVEVWPIISLPEQTFCSDLFAQQIADETQDAATGTGRLLRVDTGLPSEELQELLSEFLMEAIATACGDCDMDQIPDRCEDVVPICALNCAGAGTSQGQIRYRLVGAKLDDVPMCPLLPSDMGSPDPIVLNSPSVAGTQVLVTLQVSQCGDGGFFGIRSAGGKVRSNEHCALGTLFNSSLSPCPTALQDGLWPEFQGGQGAGTPVPRLGSDGRMVLENIRGDQAAPYTASAEGAWQNVYTLIYTVENDLCRTVTFEFDDRLGVLQQSQTAVLLDATGTIAPASTYTVEYGRPLEVVIAPTNCPGCPCEITDSSAVDVFDLLGYLDLWFAGDPVAERTGDEPAHIDVFDLLEFLDCWFPASGGNPCVEDLTCQQPF